MAAVASMLDSPYSSLVVLALLVNTVRRTHQTLIFHFSSLSIVIQLSKYAGFSPIITTASLRNADNLKSQGATHVLDRNLPDDALLAEVKKIASAPIKVAFDAVAEPKTQNVAYKAVAPGGTLAIVLPSAVENVDPEKRIIQTQGNTNIPLNRKLGVSLYSKITALLEEGVVKVSRTEYQSVNYS